MPGFTRGYRRNAAPLATQSANESTAALKSNHEEQSNPAASSPLNIEARDAMHLKQHHMLDSSSPFKDVYFRTNKVKPFVGCDCKMNCNVSPNIFSLFKGKNREAKIFHRKNIRLDRRIRAYGSGRRGQKLSMSRRLQDSRHVICYHGNDIQPSKPGTYRPGGGQDTDCPSSESLQSQSATRRTTSFQPKPQEMPSSHGYILNQQSSNSSVDPSYGPGGPELRASMEKFDPQPDISANSPQSSIPCKQLPESVSVVENNIQNLSENILSEKVGNNDSTLDSSLKKDYSLKILSYLASASSESIRDYLQASCKHFQDRFEHHRREMDLSRRYLEICDEKLKAYLS